jgi:hypothetical protein
VLLVQGRDIVATLVVDTAGPPMGGSLGGHLTDRASKVDGFCAALLRLEARFLGRGPIKGIPYEGMW